VQIAPLSSQYRGMDQLNGRNHFQFSNDLLHPNNFLYSITCRDKHNLRSGICSHILLGTLLTNCSIMVNNHKPRCRFSIIYVKLKVCIYEPVNTEITFSIYQKHILSSFASTLEYISQYISQLSSVLNMDQSSVLNMDQTDI